MSDWIVKRFIENPSPFNRWLLDMSHRWTDAKRWLESLIYFRHNAKVIEDFEDRMRTVICTATGSMMSKPYYTKDAMLPMIDQHHRRLYDEGFDDGLDEAIAIVEEGGTIDSIVAELREIKGR